MTNGELARPVEDSKEPPYSKFYILNKHYPLLS